MKKYEYQWLQRRQDLTQDITHLNELGLGGWVVCGVIPRNCVPSLRLDFADDAYLLCRERDER